MLEIYLWMTKSYKVEYILYISAFLLKTIWTTYYLLVKLGVDSERY
jgi:hypothetical protein